MARTNSDQMIKRFQNRNRRRRPPKDDPFQSRIASGSIPGFGGYVHEKATRKAFAGPGRRKISGDLGYGPNPFKRKKKRGS